MENRSSLPLKDMRSDNLDEVKKLFFYILKYWYVILPCLVLSLSAAYLINKYTHRVYPVGMSVYIKEGAGMENSAALLYSNSAFLNSNPDYYNEPYLLKADPLLEQVVRKLNFHISFYKEGRLKTTEIYPGPSIKIMAEEESNYPYGSSFLFQFAENGQSFYLKPYTEEHSGFAPSEQYQFGKQISIQGKQFMFLSDVIKTEDKDLYILSIAHPINVARSYAGRINTSWTALGASLLDISLSGTTPEKEIDFLTSLVNTYINENTESKTENATKTIEFIDQQLLYIGDSLQIVEQQLEQFKVINATGDISKEAERLLEQLRKLESEQSVNTVRHQYYQYIKEYLEQENAPGDAVVPASVGIEDPVLNKLIGQLVSLQLEINQISHNSSVENPFLPNLKARIADLQQNILVNIENQQANLKLVEQNLIKRIKILEHQIRSLPRAEREYVNIKRMYNLSEDLYLFLMRKKAEAGITKASTTSSIRVVNPPRLLGGAIQPNTNKNYIMAAVLGFGVPMGILLFLYFINDKIQYQEDLRKLTTIPLIGTVINTKKEGLVVAENPRSALAESFRTIRSNLQFFNVVQHKVNNVIGGTYLITSSMSGEGKTFCSINLATVIALSGKKTVILGADMRKPRIFENFGLNNDKGLSNYLIAQASMEEIIQKTSIDNLSLITGGIVPPNPAELLVQERMQELINKLKDIFDVIIVDSPPVGIVSDALLLWPYVDHTIYIVRQGYTHQGQIKQLNQMLDEGKIGKVSLLFNDVKMSRYGYGYGYGYGGKGYYIE